MVVDGLIPFLREVLGRVQAFNQVISHIHMKNDDDGHLMATAPASDGSLQITARSKSPIDLDGARACLGNISYLYTLLQSPLLTIQSEITLNTGEARNGKIIVRSIMFRLNERTDIQYIAADPFRESILKPMKVKIDKWPVLFEITDATIGEIAEIKKIHSTIPTGTGDDILQLTFNEGALSMEFGQDSHTTTMVLDVGVEATSRKTINLHLPSAALMSGLKQAQNKNGYPIIGQLASMAFRINSEGDTAFHELTLIRRRVRDE